MKCKKHLSDPSSIGGVCASCLREKLFALIEAQAHLQQTRERRNSDAHPPPIDFPQSVSPYTSRRESETAACRRGLTDQRFNGTSHVAPIGELISGNQYTKKKNSALSLFNRLFRSKSGNLESDSDLRISNSDDPCINTPSSSPSWFSTVLAGRREKKNRTLSLDEATIGARRRRGRNCDRGMSPARYSDEEDEEHCRGGSSGCSPQYYSPVWKQTPRSTPATGPSQRGGGGRSGLSRNVTGITFCLSPLVRASPNPRWNQKGMGMPPADMEIGAPSKSRFHDETTSFCKNRSRKLADFGRFHHNH